MSDNASDSETPNRARQSHYKLRALYDAHDFHSATLFLADLIQTADAETQECAVRHVCQTLAWGHELLLMEAFQQSQELRQSLSKCVYSKGHVRVRHYFLATVALAQLGDIEIRQHCFEIVDQLAEKAAPLHCYMLRPLRYLADDTTTAFLKAQLARFQDEESCLYLSAALFERGDFGTLHQVAMLAVSHCKKSVRDLAIVLMGAYGTQNDYDRFCQAMDEWEEIHLSFLADQAFNKYIPLGIRRLEMLKHVDHLRATHKRG